MRNNVTYKILKYSSTYYNGQSVKCDLSRSA